MPAESEWHSLKVAARFIGVDREAAVLRGMIVAQEGPFKTPGRGEFDKAALRSIIKTLKAAPNGLKSRFTHPDMSNDGLGKFLGRVKSPRMDKIAVRDSLGERKDDEISVVRTDLHLAAVSLDENAPSGAIGKYVMDLAEEDPDALSSSLVLSYEEEFRIDKKGRPMVDDSGEVLPPLWRPLKLHASDIVDTGDAVDGLLAASGVDFAGLPDAAVRQGAALLDKVFAGQPREVVEARLTAFRDRYLARRYGPVDGPEPKCPPCARGADNRISLPGHEPQLTGITEVPDTETSTEDYDPETDRDRVGRRLRLRGILPMRSGKENE